MRREELVRIRGSLTPLVVSAITAPAFQPFPAHPLYVGAPWWFLPVVGNWCLLFCLIERLAAQGHP